MRIQVLHQAFYLTKKLFVVVHLLIDLLIAMHDGRVIAIAKLRADMLPRVASDSSGQENCNVSGMDDGSLS